jgi:hypothetical protein
MKARLHRLTRQRGQEPEYTCLTLAWTAMNRPAARRLSGYVKRTNDSWRGTVDYILSMAHESGSDAVAQSLRRTTSGCIRPTTSVVADIRMESK